MVDGGPSLKMAGRSRINEGEGVVEERRVEGNWEESE